MARVTWGMLPAPVCANSTLVWFRRDLRVTDNAALAAAAQLGGPVIPVYIHAPEEDGAWRPGEASRWWLARSLASLGASLASRGSGLVVRRGPTRAALRQLLAETGASRVFLNRLYEPEAVTRDSALAKEFPARSFGGSLLFDPDAVRNGSGAPFRVFTPFWRVCLAQGGQLTGSAPPPQLTAPAAWPKSDDIPQLRVHDRRGFADCWTPGEAGAHQQLRRFGDSALSDYGTARDTPGSAGTARLSPHLHFGEVSPGHLWNATAGKRGGEGWQRQLGWREFAHHLLVGFPATPEQPLRPEFAAFPWRADEAALRAWSCGETGYPLVDAGMRELWQTGWMHNRVRMVVASFLVKHLLSPWQEGAAWFWDTLVDADLANNTLGWQWAAGCGADAAPYFRIFNPVLQGQKFDPTGVYVRRWVPELALMPDRWIHSPWLAPADQLAKAEVRLGKNYPRPLVDHAAARARALAAFSSLTGA